MFSSSNSSRRTELELRTTRRSYASKTSKSSSRNKSYASSNIDASARHNPCLLFEFGAAYLRVGIAGECKPRHVFVLPRTHQSTSALSSSSSSSSSSYWSSLPPLPGRILNRHHHNDNDMHMDMDMDMDRDSVPGYGYKDLGPWLSHLYNTLLIKPRSRRVIILFTLPSQSQQTSRDKNMTMTYHPPELRQTLQSCLLHDLNVPGIIFTHTHTCIPYAIGCKTGMIVDVGCIEGRVVCYFNGEICEETLQIVPVGYESLVQKISQWLLEEDVDIKIGTKDEIMCRIANGRDAHVKQIIHEIYYGGSQESLIYAFLNSLLQCPIDIRKEVVSNVVFVGGGVAGIPNFEQRFMKFMQEDLFTKCQEEETEVEVEADARKVSRKRAPYTINNNLLKRFTSLVPVINGAPMRVLYPLAINPSCAAWVGGSIMSAVKQSTWSNDEWVTSNE